MGRKFSFCPTSLFATGGNCIYCGRDSLRRARPDRPSESQMNNPRPWNDTSRFPRRTFVLKPTIQTNQGGLLIVPAQAIGTEFLPKRKSK